MRLFGMYAKIYERKGVVLLSSLFSAFGDLIKPWSKKRSGLLYLFLNLPWQYSASRNRIEYTHPQLFASLLSGWLTHALDRCFCKGDGNGCNGFRIEAGDIEAIKSKLKCLLCDPQLKKKLGINGYNTVKNGFNVEKNIKKLEQIYSELINKNGVTRWKKYCLWCFLWIVEVLNVHL